jgi:DNA-binding GntR family transcriptional regulator
VLPDSIHGAGDISERICATLTKAIAEGALLPGTKLLEDVIAGHFAVSRTAVRGALSILQREHLLERRRNRGTFVAEPSVAEARQLFDTRRALERAILERVVRQAGSADLDRLKALAAEEERIHDSGDVGAEARLSACFHVSLAKLSENDVLVELLEHVIVRLSLVSMRFANLPRNGCAAAEHRRIVEAISARDTERALKELDRHLNALESRTPLDPMHGDRNSFQSVLDRFSGHAR